jgi:cyanate permease
MSLLNYGTFVALGHLTAFGEEQGARPAAAAALVSTMLGIALLSRLYIGTLARRWGSYRALSLMAAIQVTGVAWLLASTNYANIAGAATLIGVGFGGYLPAFAILIREKCADAEAGRRIAEIYFFGFTAGGLGSCTAGLLRDLSGGYFVPFLIGFCSSATAIVLLACLRRRFD